MDVGVDDLKEIVRICVESGLQGIYLEVGGVRLALSRSAAPLPLLRPPAAAPVVPGRGRAPAVPAPPASAPTGPPAPSAAGLLEVRAPLLGVFHRRPAPGEPPLVEVGAEVGEEDAVCLIEVVKQLSRVPAGCRGRVAEICVEDGTLVEYGQTLMRVRPA